MYVKTSSFFRKNKLKIMVFCLIIIQEVKCFFFMVLNHFQTMNDMYTYCFYIATKPTFRDVYEKIPGFIIASGNEKKKMKNCEHTKLFKEFFRPKQYIYKKNRFLVHTLALDVCCMLYTYVCIM